MSNNPFVRFASGIDYFKALEELKEKKEYV